MGLTTRCGPTWRMNDSIPAGKVEIIRKLASDRADEHHVSIDSIRDRLASPLLIKVDVQGDEWQFSRGNDNPA